MTCAKCGYINPPDAQYCGYCGTDITGSPISYEALLGGIAAPSQRTQAYWSEATLGQDAYQGLGCLQEGEYDVAKNEDKKRCALKKHKLKRAVLTGGVTAALIAACLTCFLLFAAAPVAGWWYSNEANKALLFGERSASVYSLSGMESIEYRYERLTGEGSVLFEQAKPFSVHKDTLKFDNNIDFKRAGKGFDVKSFIANTLAGRWSNMKRAEVVEINADGAALLHTASGKSSGTYAFGVETGEGTITLGGEESSFTASAQELQISGAGAYIKEGKNFNVEAFIEEYGNPLKGAWYDKAGNIGRIDFLDEGALKLLSYGEILEGSYAFDNKKDLGRLTSGKKAFDIRFAGDALKIGEWEFTRDYTAQKTAIDAFGQLAGVWYDTAGERGTLEFSPDGSVTITSKGEANKTSCKFTPIIGEGTIAAAGGQAAKNFSIFGEKLTIDKTVYAREYTEQPDSAIVGAWYHTEGRMGVLKILNGGKAELELMGNKYSGTYTFDSNDGSGTISTTYNDRPWTFIMRLEGGKLVIETGLFIAGDVAYTIEVVKQATP